MHSNLSLRDIYPQSYNPFPQMKKSRYISTTSYNIKRYEFNRCTIYCFRSTFSSNRPIYECEFLCKIVLAHIFTLNNLRITLRMIYVKIGS